MGIEAPAKPEFYLPYKQVNYHTWFAPAHLVFTASASLAEVAAALQWIPWGHVRARASAAVNEKFANPLCRPRT